MSISQLLYVSELCRSFQTRFINLGTRMKRVEESSDLGLRMHVHLNKMVQELVNKANEHVPNPIPGARSNPVTNPRLFGRFPIENNDQARALLADPEAMADIGDFLMRTIDWDIRTTPRLTVKMVMTRQYRKDNRWPGLNTYVYLLIIVL